MRLRNKPWVKEYLITEKNYLVSNPEQYQKHWNNVFHNSNPIYIEIGSGRGKFISQLAQNSPDINYIAIEKSRNIVGVALKNLNKQEEHLKNLRWINYDGKDLKKIFAKNEISKIYLTFSDPWPKKKHAKRRLTSENFIKIYDCILARNGTIQLKTDNVAFFNFSLESFKKANWNTLLFSDDLYNNNYCLLRNRAVTEYEEKFHNQGQKICFAVFAKGYEKND